MLDLLVLPAGEASLVGPVSAQAHSNGWQVTGMHVERGRLDDVFRAITTAGEGAAHG